MIIYKAFRLNNKAYNSGLCWIFMLLDVCTEFMLIEESEIT